MLAPECRITTPHIIHLVGFMKYSLQFRTFWMNAYFQLRIFGDGHNPHCCLQFSANAYIRPMFRYLETIWTSFKRALQEFRSNKLRTFLSLLGITIGIFCIISVLSTIASMQSKIKSDLQSLGNKT